jgi:hypothetical protein
LHSKVVAIDALCTGDEYDGAWKDEMMHGKGIYTYHNGDKYDGEWREDKRHGKGTVTYAPAADGSTEKVCLTALRSTRAEVLAATVCVWAPLTILYGAVHRGLGGRQDAWNGPLRVR